MLSYVGNVSLNFEAFEIWNIEMLFARNYISGGFFNFSWLLLVLTVSFQTLPHSATIHFLRDVDVRVIGARDLHDITIGHWNLDSGFSVTQSTFIDVTIVHFLRKHRFSSLSINIKNRLITRWNDDYFPWKLTKC